MRLATDVFAYCTENLPKFNFISISGYHIREAGATAVQELAFTLANAISYTQAAIAAGLDVDSFAGRLAFFFDSHNGLFEEVAKFRAARRMWARIMRERFGARNPRSWMLRFHTQTAGVSLMAQQIDNNVVRVKVQALAAVLGGTQSLHTNARDEALALPTAASAELALRTQQFIAYESGAADVVDPLAGSYYVEWLTDRVEAGAWKLIEQIDALGGSVAAIEQGFIQAEIQESAYDFSARSSAENRLSSASTAFNRPRRSRRPTSCESTPRFANGRSGGSRRCARTGTGQARRGCSGASKKWHAAPKIPCRIFWPVSRVPAPLARSQTR